MFNYKIQKSITIITEALGEIQKQLHPMSVEANPNVNYHIPVSKHNHTFGSLTGVVEKRYPTLSLGEADLELRIPNLPYTVSFHEEHRGFNFRSLIGKEVTLTGRIYCGDHNGGGVKDQPNRIVVKTLTVELPYSTDGGI